MASLRPSDKSSFPPFTKAQFTDDKGKLNRRQVPELQTICSYKKNDYSSMKIKLIGGNTLHTVNMACPTTEERERFQMEFTDKGAIEHYIDDKGSKTFSSTVIGGDARFIVDPLISVPATSLKTQQYDMEKAISNIDGAVMVKEQDKLKATSEGRDALLKRDNVCKAVLEVIEEKYGDFDRMCGAYKDAVKPAFEAAENGPYVFKRVARGEYTLQKVRAGFATLRF